MRPGAVLVLVLVLVLACVALAKPNPNGNADLLNALSAGLERLVLNGVYANLVATWLPGASNFTNIVDYWTCGFDASSQVPSLSFPLPIRGGTLDMVLKTGRLRVASTLDFCPFMCLESVTGVVQGFEVELLRNVLTELQIVYSSNIVPVFVPVRIERDFFADLAAALTDDNEVADLVLSSVTIVPDRLNTLAFSCSYFQSPLGVLRSRLEPAVSFDVLADMNKPGVRVVVQRGTTNEIYALTYLKNAQIVVRANFSDALADVRAANVHLMIDDYFILKAIPNEETDECGNCTLLPLRPDTTGIDMWYGMAARYDRVPEDRPARQATVLGLDEGLGGFFVALICVVLLALALVGAYYYAELTAPHEGWVAGQPPSSYTYEPVVGGGEIVTADGELRARPRWQSTADIPRSASTSEDEFFSSQWRHA